MVASHRVSLPSHLCHPHSCYLSLFDQLLNLWTLRQLSSSIITFLQQIVPLPLTRVEVHPTGWCCSYRVWTPTLASLFLPVRTCQSSHIGPHQHTSWLDLSYTRLCEVSICRTIGWRLDSCPRQDSRRLNWEPTTSSVSSYRPCHRKRLHLLPWIRLDIQGSCWCWGLDSKFLGWSYWSLCWLVYSFEICRSVLSSWFWVAWMDSTLEGWACHGRSHSTRLCMDHHH